MATPPILTLQSMALTFGVTPLLRNASLHVSEGDRICLVGRNGSGKSTFLKIAAGLVEADSGERFLHPGATVRYLEQDPDLNEFACSTMSAPASRRAMTSTGRSITSTRWA